MSTSTRRRVRAGVHGHPRRRGGSAARSPRPVPRRRHRRFRRHRRARRHRRFRRPHARRLVRPPAGSPPRRSLVDAPARPASTSGSCGVPGPPARSLARDVPIGPPPRARGPDALKASVAALMARSKREIPHYYLRTTVDLGAVRRWLDVVNAGRPPAERVVPAAVLCWAVARAAAANPGLNGHWIDGAFRPADGVQLGVAVSLRGGGLLAPVIHDADALDAEELMRRLRDLTDRARHGGLRASEMVDPSITVTNLGDTGVEEVYGVIYPPQVAMVGVGRVVERPWVVDGRVDGPAGRHRHPRRRPPGHQRPRGSPLPRHHRSSAAGPGGAMERTEATRHHPERPARDRPRDRRSSPSIAPGISASSSTSTRWTS